MVSFIYVLVYCALTLSLSAHSTLSFIFFHNTTSDLHTDCSDDLALFSHRFSLRSDDLNRKSRVQITSDQVCGPPSPKSVLAPNLANTFALPLPTRVGSIVEPDTTVESIREILHKRGVSTHLSQISLSGDKGTISSAITLDKNSLVRTHVRGEIKWNTNFLVNSNLVIYSDDEDYHVKEIRRVKPGHTHCVWPSSAL